MRIIETARLRCKEGCEQKMIEEMRKMARACRDHEGLAIYRAHQDIKNPREFFWYHDHDSEESIQKHYDSPEFKAWSEIRDSLVESREIHHYVVLGDSHELDA